MTTITCKKIFASLPRTIRGQFIVINGDPKGKNFLYCNGSQVYIRNIEDPSVCDIYAEHNKETAVAKYSPSGYYIASGDVSGKVRIWDTVNPEHILKNEYHIIAGPVKDLDWSADSQKICVGGEGRQAFAKVISYDSGNSVGDMSGHSKTVNSVSMKPTRPFRIITGSEDFTAIFYEGPPFKFSCTKGEASNFVNCVRYSPTGEIFVVAGAEGKLWAYDGKNSELIGEFGDSRAHKGGIYSICFNGNGKKLMSVSGDKTAKIWNVETRTCETEFVMGNNILDMQVGCLWQGENLITVSLSGHINYLDQSNPSQPKRIIKGHNKPVTALEVSADGSTIYSASNDGQIVEWNVGTSNNDVFKGKGHTNLVVEMVLDGENLVSAGMDDTVRFHKAASQQFGESVSTNSQPRALDVKKGIAVVVCIKEILVFDTTGKKLSSMPVSFEGLSCSIHPNGSEVAIGTNSSFIVYSLSNGTLTESRKESASGHVTALAYAPDGSCLAVSNDKLVRLYDPSTWEDLTGNWSSQHTAKVTCMAWSPNSQRLMTGAIDSFICVWQLGKLAGTKPSIRAHALSYVNKLRWLDNNTVVTGGQDANLKIFSVSE